MKTRSKFILAFIAFFAFSAVFVSCKKDDDDDSSTPVTPSGPTLKTSVTGRITDTDGNVMSGVTVKLGSITTTSDNRGNYLFINVDVPKTRMVITASKSGYFKCIHAKKTQAGAANYANLMMQEYPVAVNISGTAGGVLNLTGGARITFPANAFVDANGTAYTGQVKVYARHISPGASNFEAIVPGGDLSGITVAGQTRALYSLGMIEAKLFDNSGINEIKLATGSTAELRFPIDPSQTASAQATVPLWHLNETSGFWEEDGQATKSGTYFTGTVSHFSMWNCDYPGERTDILGKVVDCQNNPMPGVVVTINNFMNLVTDNNGSFTTWVPVGYVIDCQVLQINNPFLSANSPVQSITAVAGIVNIVPPLVAPCATRIMGSVKTCGGAAASPGFIYASWNGGSVIQFTNNGQYNIFVQENTAIAVAANYNGFGGNTSVVTGAAGSLSTAPVIQLCNAGSIAQNTFTINTNGIGATTYTLSNMLSNTDYTDLNGDGIFESAQILIGGTANPGNYDCNISISLTNSVGDYYPLNLGSNNNIVISMDSMWTYGSGSPANATNNKLLFTDFGMPGGITTGQYNFDTPTGSITNGEFSIIRNE